MTGPRINMFPNKTYAGYMQLDHVDADGAEIFHVFLEGGDPSNPAVLRLMPGECKRCPTCGGCKLGRGQLHGVTVP